MAETKMGSICVLMLPNHADFVPNGTNPDIYALSLYPLLIM